MPSLARRLTFETPYANPLMVQRTPIFPTLPDPTAWGEWIFGGGTASFLSQVNGRQLIINGGAPSAPTFTPVSYLPFAFPHGLISTLPDSANQTLVMAYRKPTGQQRFIGGSLVGASGGSGVIQLTTGQIQVVRRTTAGANVVGSISAAQANAVPGDIMSMALVDSAADSRAYLRGAAAVGVAAGEKLLAATPSIGNSFYTSSSYTNSPEFFGARLYARVLSESEVRQSMDELVQRVNEHIAAVAAAM